MKDWRNLSVKRQQWDDFKLLEELKNWLKCWKNAEISAVKSEGLTATEGEEEKKGNAKSKANI